MGLADWSSAIESYEFATATHATDATQETGKRSNDLSVAPVAPVAVAGARKLSVKEREYLLNWLSHIGETKAEEIEHTISQCESDAVARKWFMDRAYKLSLFSIGDD
ncbi:MAG: hypothetical protein HKN50_02600 [Gammaproteobacteria bacterium]|nr:hypothetical protein [Gammaproteobacteria bacterium]